MSPTIADCHLMVLPKIGDPRGNLTVIEDGPFDIRRVFYLYDVPGGESRAGHANKTLQELVIAVSGSFDVEVDDGASKERFSLRRSYYGLYIPGMIWRTLDNFSSGSVCLILCSAVYDSEDYFRDYDEFLAAVR